MSALCYFYYIFVKYELIKLKLILAMRSKRNTVNMNTKTTLQTLYNQPNILGKLFINIYNSLLSAKESSEYNCITMEYRRSVVQKTCIFSLKVLSANVRGAAVKLENAWLSYVTQLWITICYCSLDTSSHFKYKPFLDLFKYRKSANS